MPGTIHNHATDELFRPGSRKKHLAVGAPAFFSGRDADGLEALLDSAGTFISRENAAITRYQLMRNLA
jgi:hypothetical protein